MMMKLIVCLLIVSSCIILMGCNALKLTNPAAETLVTQTLGLPISFRDDIIPSSKDFLFEGAKFEKLCKNGFMTKSGSFLYGYKGQITEKAKPYYLGVEDDYWKGKVHKFKTFDIVFNEIIGILINKEQQTALIRFSLKAVNVTPIGELLRKDLGAPFIGELRYKKFDTGWVLDSEINTKSIDILSAIIATRDIESEVPIENRFTPHGSAENKSLSDSGSCESSQKIGDQALFIIGEGVRVRSDPDASNLDNILFKVSKRDIPKVIDKTINQKGELWYKICYDGKLGWIISQYTSLFVIESLPIDSNQHPEGPSIFISNESGFDDLNEFFKEFKATVGEKNIQKLADFVRFPFDSQGSQMSKQDFIKTFSFTEDEIEKIKKTPSPTKYDSESYGINSESYGITFKKDKFGNWRWVSIFYGE